MPEWDSANQALWYLEHGTPVLGVIYERVGDTVYQRPVALEGILPPWLRLARTPVTIKQATIRQGEAHG